MKIARVLLLSSMATGLIAQTPTWDTSGNGMLNGTYYFRQVLYQLSSAGNGTLYDQYSLYGTVTFNGTTPGTYSMAATLVDVQGQQLRSGTVNGTYSIAASGHGFMSNPNPNQSPLYSSDKVYGSVNAQGIFVGSSTENQSGYNDLLIAAPLSNPAPTASTFKGAYSLAYIDLSRATTPDYTIGGIVTMNPDGAGGLGAVGFAGYVGQGTKGVQSLSSVKYIFSNGAAVVTFPNSTNNSAVLAGQYYLYFSPDGNFVFGGSPIAADMLVGVRTGTGTPNLNGLYYEAGLDQNESNFSAGYANLDSFYGSFKAAAGTIVGHQRLLLDSFSPPSIAPEDYTYSDTFTVPSNGAYSTTAMNYVVANGIRIGSGIGPLLGINVALQAPTMSSSLSTTGVFLNPQGVLNAGSSAPFTAGLAPGELLVLYGENLASGIQVVPGGVPFPATLGKVQVMINDIAAPIYYVTPAQVAAIVPYGVTGGIAKVQVLNNKVASNTVTEWIAKTAPGVLTQTANGLGYGDVVHPEDGALVNANNPARIGEVVSVYLTGLGAVSPTIADGAVGPGAPLSETPTGAIAAYIGGVPATLGYSGLAPSLGGLYQINLTVPAGVAAGDHFLDIAGPDAYSSVCVIAIASAPGSSPEAVPALRTVPHAVPHAVSPRGAITPTRR